MVKGKWMVRRLVGDLVVSNHCECTGLQASCYSLGWDQ